jgi:glycosyltransferase involved in cell wall biosynthesis
MNSKTATQRIGVICDFAEEEWPSMDLVGDMLVGHLPAASEGRWYPEAIRPPMRRVISNLPLRFAQPHRFNIDRLLNRFVVYPRFIRRVASRFALVHIVDHSYSHLLHQLEGVPTLVTCHDLDTFRCLLSPEADPRPRWFRSMAGRILTGFKKAGHVICVSETIRQELLDTGWFSADKITVIHNGVHPSCSVEPDQRVDAEIEQLAHLRRGQVVLLHVGSTVPRKRIDVLLRVFRAVRETIPEAVLVRVGGAFTHTQSALADELRVSGAIRTMPFLDRMQLASLYRRADLLLLTSEGEGFGLPLAEALACGCPVVASDLPVLREVGGTVAQFCPPGDVENWASRVSATLAALTAAPEMRERMRQRSVALAQRFSWTENARQSAAVYDEILSLRRCVYASN